MDFPLCVTQNTANENWPNDVNKIYKFYCLPHAYAHTEKGQFLVEQY